LVALQPKENNEMRTPYELRLEESLGFLRSWAKGDFVPKVAVVLGSGLSGVFPKDSFLQSISYNDLPGFKTAAVKGHSGSLGLIEVSGIQVAVLQGRVHGYEGYDPGEVTHNLRTLVRWGAKHVVLTNAAGCLIEDWKIGEVMVITDHINATHQNPIAGAFGSGFGERFVDMTNAYSKRGVELAAHALAAAGGAAYTGVYYGVAGPSYETPAEVRLFRQQGAHAVGMSTVLETLAARQLGAQVMGLSCLTNFAAGIKGETLAHEDVLATGASAQAIMATVLPQIIPEFSKG
jgi:purine-nucleoside phosphorylase